MEKGLQMARQNRYVTVPEAEFMVPNPLGIPLTRLDMGSDGNGLTNPQNWSGHMADGSTLSEGDALTGEEGVVTRTFMPRYDIMESIWRQTAGLPVSDVLTDNDTRFALKFTDPEDEPPAVETVNGYYGSAGNSVLLTGGKLRAWNIDVARSDNGGSGAGGNIDYHFNRWFGPNHAVPGRIAHNSLLYVEAYNPAENLVLSVKVGAAVAAAVTILPNANNAAIKAAFEAHADIVTAVVIGDVATGKFTVEITAPANTKVIITKTSGLRWAIMQRQFGGAAAGMVIPKSAFLEADHVRLYRAVDEADLATIDFDDRPDLFGNDGDEHLMATASASTFAIADLWKPHYSQTGKRFATQLVAGARTMSMSLQVPNDTTPGSDVDFLMKLQEGCLSSGFWLVRVFSCGKWEYKEEVYVGRNGEAGYSVVNDVYMREFPLVRRRNPESENSANFYIKGPVAERLAITPAP